MDTPSLRCSAEEVTTPENEAGAKQINDSNPDLDSSVVPIPTKGGEPMTVGVGDQVDQG